MGHSGILTGPMAYHLLAVGGRRPTPPFTCGGPSDQGSEADVRCNGLLARGTDSEVIDVCPRSPTSGPL
jgi:hypothetical protein